MADKVPSDIWEIVKEFTALIRGREAEVCEACRQYLAGELKRFRASKRAKAPAPPKLPAEPETGATKKELEEYETHRLACQKYQMEWGRTENFQSANAARRWLEEHPVPEDMDFGEALTILLAGTQFVTKSTENKSRPLATRIREPKLPKTVLEGLAIYFLNPKDYTSSETLAALLEYVREAWNEPARDQQPPPGPEPETSEDSPPLSVRAQIEKILKQETDPEGRKNLQRVLTLEIYRQWRGKIKSWPGLCNLKGMPDDPKGLQNFIQLYTKIENGKAVFKTATRTGKELDSFSTTEPVAEKIKSLASDRDFLNGLKNG